MLKLRDLSKAVILRLAPMVDCPVSGPGFFMSAIGALVISNLTILLSVATHFFSVCNPDSINTTATVKSDETSNDMSSEAK